jgi:hypothetical protein
MVVQEMRRGLPQVRRAMRLIREILQFSKYYEMRRWRKSAAMPHEQLEDLAE